jgi:hypothetical protein
MYRAECRNGFDSGSDKILDCYFHVHHALRGKILYLNDILGVYRLNVGIASTKNDINSIYLIPASGLPELCMDAIEYAGCSGVEADLINKSKAKSYFDFSYGYLMAKDFQTFKLLINKSYETARLHNIQFLFKFFSRLPSFLFFLVRLRADLREKFGK